MRPQIERAFLLIVCLALPAGILAHHFKGLPHYGYFENYPQTPVEEYLGQSEEFEFFLVIYDFQGLEREKVDQPDDVRFFLNIYDLKRDRAYGGPVFIEILDGEKRLHEIGLSESEQESLYTFNRKLPFTGDFSLRATLRGDHSDSVTIPFELSHQKIAWGKWLALALALIVLVAAIGSRRARIARDRQAAHKEK